MPQRSPALARLCDAATRHFAAAGYDGASLSEIAAMIGIRKASLYSHVAGKDALFLLLLADAARIESGFAADTLAGPAGAQGPGADYAAAIGPRFDASVHLRFLLRSAYLPPPQHRAAVHEAFEGFLAVLRDGYLRQLRDSQPHGLAADQSERLGDAWLGVVDSLFVELFYAGRARMERRRMAMWQILTDSLTLRTGRGGDHPPAPNPACDEA
ncbi:MAG: helix-turn-helix domain-containing protein [Paracoccus aminovorans]|nr:helix-turn-helix domain-containing protein [Paracoccus aminovorans]